jgi:ParB/RepB/Spo0J family partition protein
MLKSRERAKAKKAAAPASEPVAEPETEVPVEPTAGPLDIFLRHDQIRPSADNPRKDFEDEALAGLAESIAEHGLMQNLVVIGRPDDPGQYTLIAGERRWRAIAQLIEDGRWPPDRQIPVRYMDGLDAKGVAIHALMENLMRADLKPLEEARAFRALVDDHGLSTDTIADQIHCTRRLVQQRLQLLELSDADQKRLDEGKLTIEEARRRLANRAPEVVLSDAAKFLLAEILHKLEHDKYGQSNEVEVQPDAGGEAFDALRAEYWIGAPSEAWEDGVKSGHLTISVATYYSHRWPKDLPEVSAPYGTAWLNGPFEISAEVSARVATDRAEREKARRPRDESIARERLVFQARLSGIEALRATAPSTQGLGQEIGAHLKEVGAPLPWCVHPNNETLILDATGRQIIDTGWGDKAKLLARLTVIAANVAAGLATPDLPPAVAEVDEDDGWDEDEEEDGGIGEIDPTDHDSGDEASPASAEAEPPAFLQRLAGVKETV